MKYLFLLLLLCSFTYTTEPKHVGLNGVKVLSAKTQQILGKNVGYYLVIENGSKRMVDGVKWKAIFTDNFGEVKGEKEGKWQSGNFVSPIKPSSKTEDLESTWISGATKVQIKITDVHFI